MKQVKFIALLAFIIFLSSCTVTESIIFNEDMGGTYRSKFDLSAMMQMAGEMAPSTQENEIEKEKMKMDTIIRINDFMVAYKDSIATLSPEKQKSLMAMKDMSLHLELDEEANSYLLEASKPFTTFSDIEFVSYQMEEMFAVAKAQSGQTEKASGGGDDLLSQEKVTYTFENNTFRRVDPKKLVEEGGTFDLNLEEEEKTEEEELASSMMESMLGQFDDMLEESSMTLTYTFPKKIKSVSHDGAVISEDGKTVTYTTDWKTLTKDKELLRNFEVVLED